MHGSGYIFPREESEELETEAVAVSMAASHGGQLWLLSPQPFACGKRRNQHPSVITRKFTQVPGVSMLPSRQLYSAFRAYPEAEGHNSEIIATFFC